MEIHISCTPSEMLELISGPDIVRCESTFDPITPANLDVFGLKQGAAPVHPRLLLPARMEKMHALGDLAKHSMVGLPDFGLTFTTEFFPVDNADHADKLASECRIGGFDDWVMPEVFETILIVDYGRHSPAIDPEFFPGTKTDRYFLTATKSAANPDYAWGVNFSNGGVYGGRRDVNGYVRAVRRVPASQ